LRLPCREDKLNILYIAKGILYRSGMIVAHLKSLQALELAVRTGSLKAASEQLGITPAAVGQRIKALEDYLGLDLLVRGRSGIRPTRELSAALAHLSAAFREMETVARVLDFQRVHEIHVVADTDWADLWLRPRLAGFKAQNPNILFCVNGVGDVPMRLGQADCEIWFGPSRNGSEEDELFRDYLLPVSSPENTRRVSAVPSAERLEGFPLLHLDCYHADPSSIGWPQWVSRYGYRKTAAGRGIRYARIVQALEAVYSDAGLLICGLALAQGQLESGRLSLPFPLRQGAWTGHAYRVAFKETAARRSQVGLFRSWLHDTSRQTTAYLRQQTAELRS
jgi:LysR family glycine cleavage system transcriptional activator